MSIITEPGATPSAPNTKTTIAESTAGIPNSKTTVSAENAAIPNAKTTVAESTAVIPNSKTTIAEASSAIPTVKTTVAAVNAAIPNSKTTIGVAGIPRSIAPLVNMDFAANLFAQCNIPVLFDDLFTYSRASSATFINRRIVCGKAEFFLDTDFVGTVTNLLTFSEQFDNNDWTKTRASITPNATRAPDGTLTADKLVENTSSSNTHFTQQAVSLSASTDYSLTLSVKKGERRSIQLRNNTLALAATFDVSSGVVLSTSAGVIASIGAETDGWFELSITFDSAAGGSQDLQMRLAIGESSVYTGDGSSGLFIWGAQLTESAKAQPYVKTISTSASDTFTETLRVEYDPVTGENLGALIEGGSTNLALRSEEFDDATWVKTRTDVTANTIEAPDGTTSGDQQISNDAGESSVRQTVTITASANITLSAFVKRGNTDWCHLMTFNGAANGARVWFNIRTGAIGGATPFGSGWTVTGSEIKQLDNGWFKISATFATDGTTSALVRLSPSDDDEDSSSAVGLSLFMSGAQLKELSFPTSYIRTEGSTVSMVADIISLPIAGNHPEANSDATYLIDVDFDELPTGGTGSSRYLFNVDETSGFIAALVNSGGDLTVGHGAATVVASDGSFASKMKLVIVYKSTSNNLKAYIDGIEIFSGDAGVQVALASDIFIGNNDSGNLSAFCNIKAMQIFDVALTAQEVSLL